MHKLILLLLLSLYLTLCVTRSIAGDKIYYHHSTREISISNSDETLLVFQAPPVATICQPQNILELYAVQNIGEIHSLTVPQGASLMESLSDSNSESQNQDMLPKLLKLVPSKNDGKTTCAIKLANHDTVNIKFSLNQNTFRPILELESIFGRKNHLEENISVGRKDAHELFKQLVVGGELTYLSDVTPSKIAPKTYTKKNARYKFHYIGTDSKAFKAWIIEFKSRYTQEVPHFLTNTQMGDIYYSVFKYPKNFTTPNKVGPQEVLNILVLSRHDLEINDMLERLP